MPRSKEADIPDKDSAVADGGRIPPQDIDAERSLLGAILIDDTMFPDVLERIKPSDFYDKRHFTIYRAMVDIYNSNQKIDLVTLTAELRGLKALKDVGGSPYLAELTNVVPTASHIMSYVDVVERNSIRRRLISAGTKIATDAYDNTKDIKSILGNAEKTLFEVSDSSTKTDYVPMEDLLVDAFNRMEELHKNHGALRGLKTGFSELDAKTAGFQNGDLIVIGARPSMGKTTLAQNLAYNIASINKRGVLFFSMEMSKNEIIDRMISPVSGVDAWNIRTGNISNEDFEKIGDAMGEMGEVPIYIDDTGEMSVLELRNKARRAVHDHNIGIIIIDYLTLLSGTGNYSNNRVQEVTEISRSLKTLARELEIPVVALAQLNRNVSGRDDPRPVLSDLRESGSIEQDADLVMMIHRVDYYHHEPDYVPTNITELIIQKHRHGPLGTIKLYFHSNLNYFQQIDPDHSEA